MNLLRIAFSGLASGLAFATGLLCAIAALAAHGGRFSAKLDILTHFAPFWLAGAVLAFLMGLLTPRGVARVVIIATGLTGAAAAAGLMLPEYLRPMSERAAPDAPHQIRIVQFNAWGPEHVGKIDIRPLIALKPDILVVEEASLPLRDALRREFPYYVASESDAVMIFSHRRPIGSGVRRVDPRMAWVPVARATFDAPGGPFTVAGIHADWPTKPAYQRAQGRRAALVLSDYPTRRLILTGDFNSTPWSFTRQREDTMYGMERRTRALFSWPAAPLTAHRIAFPFPVLPIDHVYAGRDWKTVKIERGPAVGSDHFPIVATLALDAD